MAKVRGGAELSALTDQITQKMAAGGQPRANRPIPAPTQLMHLSADYQRMAKQVDELKNQKGVRMYPLSKIRPSPHQAGPLNPERVQGLVANLANNPLASPVILRAVEGTDEVELVAGHHRVQAFKELKREEIPGVEVELSDDEAERLVFYDNLLAPSLSDYEKYLGLSKRRGSRGFGLQELAEESGVSKSTIANLLSFEKLPEAAMEVVRAHPKCFGASLMGELSALKDVDAERLAEAFKKVVTGELTQAKVPAWLSPRKPAEARQPAEKSVVRQGNQIFAEVVRRGQQLSIKMASSVDPAEIEQALLAVLKDYSKKSKSS